MALDNIPTLGPGSLNGNLDKVLVYKNGGSEVAVSLLTLTNSALNPSGIYLDATNQRVGIGTSSPIAPLNVYNSSSSVSSVILVEQDTSATIGQINQYRKNGSVNLTSGTEIGRLSFGGYFNSTYSPFSQVCSAIIGYYGGTGTDRTGGLRLTTWNGGGATTRLQVAPDGKVSIGTTGSSAKLQIVGEGSTSATTSLLVQNSSSVQSLKVLDDGTTELGNSSLTGANILTLTSTYGSVGILVGGGGTMQVSGSIRSMGSNIQVTDYFVGIRILLGNGNARLAGGTTSWLDVQNVSGTSAAGNLSANLGTFGTTYATINDSAQVEIASTTKGFLKPRLTTAQKNAIATPAAGLEVYDTDLNRPCFYNGTSWITL